MLQKPGLIYYAGRLLGLGLSASNFSGHGFEYGCRDLESGQQDSWHGDETEIVGFQPNLKEEHERVPRALLLCGDAVRRVEELPLGAISGANS